MSETAAALRYARALFDLAEKDGKLDEIDHWLSLFAEDAERYPKVTAFVQSPVISQRDKMAFMEKLFPEGTPPLLRDFCKILIEKRRFVLLPEIRDLFHSMYDHHRGSLEVELLSVVPFSEKLKEKLRKVLNAKLRSDVHLVPKTDPSLIGGFVVRFDGKEIDCSYKTRLYEIEQQLIQI